MTDAPDQDPDRKAAEDRVIAEALALPENADLSRHLVELTRHLPTAVMVQMSDLEPPPGVAVAEAAGRRWCFHVIESQHNEHGYVPSVLVEGASGHHPMVGRNAAEEPWYWGDDLASARVLCAQVNEARGLGVTDVVQIVASMGCDALGSAAALDGQDRLRDLALAH